VILVEAVEITTKCNQPKDNHRKVAFWYTHLMQRELKQELASFGIVFINALPLLPSFLKKWLIRHVIGITPLQAHILVERAAMYKPYGKFKTLWQFVMWRDKRVCQIRTKGICITVATQVDHIQAVWRYGRSIPDNLQAACAPCNVSKGVKILEQASSSKQTTAVMVILLFILLLVSWIIWRMLVN
jgi:hypothetical protein